MFHTSIIHPVQGLQSSYLWMFFIEDQSSLHWSVVIYSSDPLDPSFFDYNDPISLRDNSSQQTILPRDNIHPSFR
jgi:hypothetical protein